MACHGTARSISARVWRGYAGNAKLNRCPQQKLDNIPTLAVVFRYEKKVKKSERKVVSFKSMGAYGFTYGRHDFQNGKYRRKNE